MWTLVLAMIMSVTLLPTLASASAAPVAMEIPTDAQVKEVGTWDELVIGIADISAAGDYYFKITDDLTADSTIKLPGGTAKIEYAVYIYCAADHSIGRAVTFSDPMFIMGNNGPCNAVVTLAFGGINGGSLTISDSGVISTGVIYGYGGIGANSAVELYDGVIFEDNGISNSLWEFSGWKAADGTIYTSDELADLTIEQDSTFTAQYASKNQETYIVSFDRGTTQGSITGVTEFNVPSGESLNSMNYAVPGQSTFGTVVFDCWEDSYGDYYSSEQIAALEITEDMNFIARWKLNTGEISIYFKNEYLDYPKSSNDWSFINVQTGSKLDSSNPPAAKQRAGYDFVGWMSTNGTFYTQEELMAKEFYHTESFVAKFTRNDGNVSVSFDSGNHGSISSKDIIISKGSTIADSGENVPAVKPASATTGGALIYTIGSSTVVRMYGGEIRNNTSNSSIGGMINTNNFEMYGGKIEHNKVYGVSGNSIAGGGVNCDNLIMKGGSVSYNTLQASAENAVAYGAGLYVGTSAINGYSYKEIQITGGTITGNKGLGYDGTPEGDGGGICFYSTDFGDTVKIQLSNVTITDNTAGFGGGIACTDTNPDTSEEDGLALVLGEGCIIDGNTAQYGGGGVFFTLETAKLRVEGAQITNNHVTTTSEFKEPYRSWQTSRDMLCGGGLYWHSPGTEIDKPDPDTYDIELSGDVVIDGNHAYNGGGAYLLGDGVIQNHISFLSLYIPSGVSITNNVATNDGGGIYCGRSNEDITKGRPAYVYVTGGSITGNTAGNAGGGIYNTGAAIISGGTFGNTATALSTSSEVYHSGLTMLEYDPSETWLGVPDDSLVLSGSVDLSGGSRHRPCHRRRRRLCRQSDGGCQK